MEQAKNNPWQVNEQVYYQFVNCYPRLFGVRFQGTCRFQVSGVRFQDWLGGKRGNQQQRYGRGES